jgi:WD40 repeat protein
MGQLNALRVFRDATDLTASPDLWGRVTGALDASRYLVVVLSPTSARSVWVNKEVGYWLDKRGPDRLFLVTVGGRLFWDEAARRFDPERSEVALPVMTRPGSLPNEPFYVDVSQNAPWDPRDAVFRETVTDLAAPMHGRSKYELASDDLREQRRYRRWRRTAITALAVLTVCAGLAATLAAEQRREAIRQRDVARHQTTLAVARALSAGSRALVEVRLDTALLLAEAGTRRDPAPDNQGALLGGLLATPELSFLPPAPAAVTALHPLASGGVAAGTADGSIELWGNTYQRASSLPSEGAAISALATTLDGARIAAGDASGHVALYDLRTYRRLWSGRTSGSVVDVALAPNGALAATDGSEVTVWRNPVGGTPEAGRGERVDAFGENLAFDQDGLLAVTSADGNRTMVLPTEPLRAEKPWGTLAPFNGYTWTFSPHGRWYAYKKFGGLLVDLEGREGSDAPPDGASLRFDSEASTLLAVDDTGRRFAEALPNGSLEVTSFAPVFGGEAQAEPRRRVRLGGFVNGENATFTDAGSTLVVAGGRSVAVYRLGASARLARVLPAELPAPACTACFAEAASSPDGSAVTWTMNGRLGCVGMPRGRVRFSAHRIAPGYLSATYNADGRLLLAGTEEGITIWHTTSGCPTGRPERLIAGLPYADSLVRAGNDRVVVSSFDEDTSQVRLSVVRPATGTIDMTLPGRSATTAGGSSPFVDAIAFLPAENAVAVFYDDQLMRLFDLDAGRWRSQVRLDAPVVSAVAGRGGRTVVAASGGSVRELTMRGRLVREFAGKARQLSASPDGRVLAGLRDDGRVLLWDSATGVLIGTLPAQRAARVDVSSSVDGMPDTTRTAIAVSSQGIDVVSPAARMVHWRLGLKDWLDQACRVAGRDLDTEEWTRFTGTSPPPTLRCGATP